MTAVLWQVEMVVPVGTEAAFGRAADGIGTALSMTELEPGGWRLTAYFEAAADAATGELFADFESRIAILAAGLGVAAPAVELRAVPPADWVARIARDFPPLSVGRFYIRGTHVRTPPPPGRTNLTVDAGLAFGTGEHATTAGCLLAIERLRRRMRAVSVLDIGCGTGILAIAMAKTWRPRRPVIATDIDPVAVAVARANARRNGVASDLRIGVADGFRGTLIRAAAPFDVIVANILARPLCDMAPALARHLALAGVAVLAGLLSRQEAEIRAAYRAQGLYVMGRFESAGWPVLVVAGPARARWRGLDYSA